MKNKLSVLLLVIGIFYFNSCDLLRFIPFEVISWMPGDGYHSSPENITVSLIFSILPDKESIERNFSLTADGSRVRGTYHWKGRNLIFSPLAPLEINTDYTITVSADAHDIFGLSLDGTFSRNFTTRTGTERPVLISCYPSMYEEVVDSRAEVKLVFSNSVPISTLYENISFNPSMTGFWQLEDDGKTAIFTPAEPWTQNSRYELRISASFTNNNRINMGSEFSSVFTIGTAREPPQLLHLYRITKNGEIFELNQDGGFASAAESPVENSGVEKDDKFLLVFSKPVDSISVRNYAGIENGQNIVMENSAGYNTEFIFKFENTPVYESRFTLRIRPGIKDIFGNESKEEYIYRIFANGKLSKPPKLEGIRIPMAPLSETDQEILWFETNSLFKSIPITEENYPSGESVKTWIELYFSASEGASIDLFSLMEFFRIETSNNVINFSLRQIKTSNYTVPEPYPHEANYHRFELVGYLTNTTNYGIINFQIASGLQDSFGNKNESLQRISVIK